MNPSGLELKGYLDKLRAAGASTGEASFTIDQQKAWEKLGALQLRQPHLWVLKIVQAAVAGRANSLEIAQGVGETVFVIQGAPGWTRERLHAAALLSEHPEDPGLGHLAVAIRALAKGTSLPFLLGYPDGLREAWTGDRFTTQGQEPAGSNFALVVAHHRLADRRDSESDMRAMGASIGRLLTSYAYTAPIPIQLDRRRINGVEFDPEFGISPHSVILSLLEIPPSELCPALEVTTSPDLAGTPAFRLTRGWTQRDELCQARVGGLGLVTAHFKRSRHHGLKPYAETAQLLWVRDGVVVNRDRLWYSGPVSVGVLLNASGLETDLSGMELSWSDARSQQRDYVIGSINGRLGVLARQSQVLQKRALRHWEDVDAGLLSRVSRWIRGQGRPLGAREQEVLVNRVGDGIKELRRRFVE